MTISTKLFSAVLALDAYNRGYDNKLILTSNALGDAIVSNPPGYDDLQSAWQNSSFYAVAYDWNGAKVISFRGTDDPNVLDPYATGDMFTGWTAGAGMNDFSAQLELAEMFYCLVVGHSPYMQLPSGDSSVIVTGHSLGGGLAGYISGLSGALAYGFDHMPFYNSALNALDGTEFSFLGDRFTGVHVNGEVLEWVRGAGNVPYPPPFVNPLEDQTNFEDSIALPDSELSTFGWAELLADPTGYIRHNQSLLVTLLYASENEGNVGSTWHTSGFVTSLFDAWSSDAIATSANIDGSTGNSSAADQMQAMIAYSVVDEGERPYGDSAIRAMFNDAKDIGDFLETGSSALLSQSDIAETIVRYAALLARYDIEGEFEGVVGRNGNLLSIDFTQEKWTFNGTPVVLGGFGRDFSDLLDDGKLSLIEQVNLDSGPGRIEYSYFSSAPGGWHGNIVFESAMYTVRAVGSDTQDTIIGTDGDEQIILGSGNDTVVGNGGVNWIDGGDGIDTLIDGHAWSEFEITFDIENSRYYFALRNSGYDPRIHVLDHMELFTLDDVKFDAFNIMNAAPTGVQFIADSGEVESGAVATGDVIASLAAVDMNASDAWTFELTDASDGLFRLDEHGNVYAQTAITFDYEVFKNLWSDSQVPEIIGGVFQSTAAFAWDIALGLGYAVEAVVTDSYGKTAFQRLVLNVSRGNEIIGTAGNDILHGTPDRDIISGLAGNDTIFDHEGDDIVYGGNNNDIIYGGLGSDAMFGENQDDDFHLGEGEQGDVDYVSGGSGIDELWFSVGATYRLDAVGADAIRNQVVPVGYSVAVGNGFGIDAGDFKAYVQTVEKLYAAAAPNELYLRTGLGGLILTSIDFTAGNQDEAFFEGSGGMNVIDLKGEQGKSVMDRGIKIYGIEKWNLSTGADTVLIYQSHSSASQVEIFGRSGNNTAIFLDFTEDLVVGLSDEIAGTNVILHDFLQIYTGSGNDTFHGSDAAELFDGGSGANLFYGSLGADILVSSGVMTVDYSASIAAVKFQHYPNVNSNASGYYGYWSRSDVSPESLGYGDKISPVAGATVNIIGTAFDDVISLEGNAGEIQGRGGNDTLLGGFANNRLIGGSGYEIVRPGDGSDYVDFQTGGGVLDFSTATIAGVIDMSAGTFVFGTQTDVVLGAYSELKGTSKADTIRGTDQGDIIDGGGGTGSDLIYGLGGNDEISVRTGIVYGGDGADVITLSGQNSLAFGGEGDDLIRADQYSAGSILYGEDGNDVFQVDNLIALIGGAGADIFRGSDAKILDYSTSGVGVRLEWVDNRTSHGFGGDADGDLVEGGYQFIGSAFDDYAEVQYAQFAIHHGGAGNDTIKVASGGNVTLYGDEGNDVLTSSQNAYGGTGNDSFFGFGNMFGEAGDDQFFLGIGTATVRGGAGTNVIEGGSGNSTVYMDEGSDTFIFQHGGGQDRVFYAGADDTIILKGIAAFDDLADVAASLQQVGSTAQLAMGSIYDHKDDYPSGTPNSAIGTINFSNMTVSQVLALHWDFM